MRRRLVASSKCVGVQPSELKPKPPLRVAAAAARTNRLFPSALVSRSLRLGLLQRNDLESLDGEPYSDSPKGDFGMQLDALSAMAKPW
jgi:hypothetical protein